MDCSKLNKTAPPSAEAEDGGFRPARVHESGALRNPKPKPDTETQNPKPETRNPKPETRNRNPKHETRNTKPEIRRAPGQRCRAIGAPQSQFENNCFTEMCSGSEAGSYLRLTDFCITQL